MRRLVDTCFIPLILAAVGGPRGDEVRAVVRPCLHRAHTGLDTGEKE